MNKRANDSEDPSTKICGRRSHVIQQQQQQHLSMSWLTPAQVRALAAVISFSFSLLFVNINTLNT